MTTQFPQTSAIQPETDFFPVFSSLRPMDGERKIFRVSFPFTEKINYWTEDSTKQLLRSQKRLILGVWSKGWRSSATDQL